MFKFFTFLVFSCVLLMGSSLGAQERPYLDEDADGIDDRTVRRAPIKEGADATRGKGAGSKKIKVKRRGPGAEGKAILRDARGLRASPEKGVRTKLRAAVAEDKLTAGEARRRLARRPNRNRDAAAALRAAVAEGKLTAEEARRRLAGRPARPGDKAGERKSGDSDSRKRGGG